ncbi:LAMI_0H14334g1_1 [Lachancea mirantina]|uniref:Actin-related protein 4 n=1 Tax=Lachancea mirantina TaxID=1230905 RepID=A0A1G4KIG6_9SACH|nr:LAMI_0H14334g1_1 [Lachancea mirantina]
MSNPALQVYGGDEISAVVIDPGSYNLNVGHSGTDCPQVSTPSSYGGFTGEENKKRIFSEQAMKIARENYEIKPVVENGCITDWDAAEEQWTWAIENEMRYETTKGIPAFLTEPIWNNDQNRKKSLEVLLESLEFEACYIAPTPTCVSFSMGRPTCLVVDIGHDVASVSPVIDGMTLTRNSTRNFLAGRFMNSIIEKQMEPIQVWPLFKVAFKKPQFVEKKFPFSVDDSLSTFATAREFYQECKETMLHIAPVNLAKFKEDLINTSKRSLEAPWGQNIVFDSETRYGFGEQLFNPQSENLINWPTSIDGVVESWHNDYVPPKRTKPNNSNKDKEATAESTPAPPDGAAVVAGSETINENGKRPLDEPQERENSAAGLSDLVYSAIMNTDVDLRAALAYNVIVTGGTSSIPGLTDRLMDEMNRKLPALKFRMLTTGHLRERQYQAWLGGSILSSLGTFHQLWVGRREYEEVGAERLLKDRFR